MTREGTIPQPVAQRILAGEAKQVEGIARPGHIFIGMSYAVGGEARWDERIYQLADGDRHHVTDELHVEFGGYTYRIANIGPARIGPRARPCRSRPSPRRHGPRPSASRKFGMRASVAPAPPHGAAIASPSARRARNRNRHPSRSPAPSGLS